MPGGPFSLGFGRQETAAGQQGSCCVEKKMALSQWQSFLLFCCYDKPISASAFSPTTAIESSSRCQFPPSTAASHSPG